MTRDILKSDADARAYLHERDFRESLPVTPEPLRQYPELRMPELLPLPGDYAELVDENNPEGPVRLCRKDGTAVALLTRETWDMMRAELADATRADLLEVERHARGGVEQVVTFPMLGRIMLCHIFNGHPRVIRDGDTIEEALQWQRILGGEVWSYDPATHEVVGNRLVCRGAFTGP